MSYEDKELAPAVPTPKFSVGDRVKVNEKTPHGDEGVLVARLDQYEVRPFLVMFDDCWLRRYDENEMTAWRAPITWNLPDASRSVGLDTLDDLVHEMVDTLKRDGGDCDSRRFADVLVVVENGQAKVYRLEAIANAE
jgi:hypothetical protein